MSMVYHAFADNFKEAVRKPAQKLSIHGFFALFSSKKPLNTKNIGIQVIDI